ncbi:DUF4962 domain-containing protein [Alteromonas sp. 14N.309.X.WAT.G.H12]|uniref:DUF4962 domain-containing protein n=1 Tax=Alteromonas sp. 14N.309.X.WAT.G.H12 TaxID=3120824 RepID=UPI002FD620BC
MNYLLINEQLDTLKAELGTCRKNQFTRLIEQCRLYENEPLSVTPPATSVTYMGMASANLSLAYLLTEQPHYLEEAKRWIFTAVGYDVWGYGFLVDVDLSASWLLFGLGLSYDWLKDHLSDDERQQFLEKLILQGNKIFDYGQENLGHCWSTNFWQNHNWINYAGLLTTAYAIVDDYPPAQVWIDEIKTNFDTVFKYMPEDGSNYEGTGYWRFAINFFLVAADLIRKDGGNNHFETDFLKNTFYYRLYQSNPNWEENVNFADVHDKRSSHSIGAYYKIAREYNNGHAQWLGELVREKFLFREAYQSKIFPGILPEAFLEMIWYQPKVKPIAPDALPLSVCFPDLGLVVMRSSWEIDATHLSFKCSPPGGHKQWALSWQVDEQNQWHTRSLTHYHVDFNSFILIHNGTYLAIDEGYNRTSKAEIHNMITVDGTGCVGEKIWDNADLSDPELFDLNCKGIFNVWKDVPREATAQIETFYNQDDYTYAVGESSKMYYPEMQLSRNARHIINSQCGYFILLDELASALEHTYTWRIHSEKFADNINPNQFEIVNGNGALSVFPIAPQSRKVRIEETLVEEVMTPQRPDDIRRISLKTLLIENAEPAKNMAFLTVMQPKTLFSDAPTPPISVTPLHSDHWQGVEITSQNYVETFLYAPKGNMQYEGVTVHATWLSVVKDKAGKLIKTTQYTQPE